MLHRTARSLGRRLGLLAPAVVLLGLTLLLAVGCTAASDTGGTGSGGASTSGGAAPRSTITPPPAPPPIRLPLSNTQPPSGAPAIKPHLGGVPSFTTDDMAAYVKAHPLPDNFGTGGAPTIVQNTFLPADAVSQLLNMPGSAFGQLRTYSGEAARRTAQSQSAPVGPVGPVAPADAKLLGLVVLQGTFVFPPATPDSPPPTSPYAYEVFDAQSGNLLADGGLSHPSNATPTPTTNPTGGPTPTPTPRPRPTPTNTPAPTCTLLLSGTGTMNVDKIYLDVDSGGSATNPGNLSAGADVQWSPSAGVMQPINGALLADAGKIGAGGFNGLTCAQLKGAKYGGGSVPAADTEVFLVKSAVGHYAKVLVSVIPGALGPALRWQTYA
jgi:hypothetical protein